MVGELQKFYRIPLKASHWCCGLQYKWEQGKSELGFVLLTVLYIQMVAQCMCAKSRPKYKSAISALLYTPEPVLGTT